jgi:nitroreductase
VDVKAAIQSKRAVRLFKAEPVPEADLKAVLDAGRRSQSAKNTQPWRFIVIRDKAILKALSQTGEFAGHLAGAAFAVAFVGKRAGTWDHFDFGQAAAYMQLAAWELGIGSCIASIADEAEGRAVLGIPEDLNLYVAISFGYPSPDFVPAKMGGRQSLENLVHWEKWGNQNRP